MRGAVAPQHRHLDNDGLCQSMLTNTNQSWSDDGTTVKIYIRVCPNEKD